MVRQNTRTHTCMLNTFMTYVCSGARRAFPECVRGAPSGSEQRAGGSDADPGTVQPAAHAAAASRRKCCRASWNTAHTETDHTGTPQTNIHCSFWTSTTSVLPAAGGIRPRPHRIWLDLGLMDALLRTRSPLCLLSNSPFYSKQEVTQIAVHQTPFIKTVILPHRTQNCLLLPRLVRQVCPVTWLWCFDPLVQTQTRKLSPIILSEKS